MSLKKVLVILTAVLALTIAAYGTPTDSGASITNTVGIRGTNFTDTGASYDTTVTAIYGDTLHKFVTAVPVSANVGDTRVFNYYLYNTGNTAESFTIFAGSPVYSGGAETWTYEILNGTGVVQSTTAVGETIGFTIANINMDAMDSFAVRIITSSNPANAPDGSQAVVRVVIVAGNPATGQYTGDNTLVYAHDQSNIGVNNNDTPTVIIASANFTITKSGVATIGGVASAPIPGATIFYTVNFNNAGSGAGDNVVIYDRLDTAVVSFAQNIAANYDTTVGGVTWTFEWTTIESPDHSFAQGAWVRTEINAGNKGTVRWIRWKAASAASAATGDIFYSVWIK